MADREKVIKAVGSCFDYWLDQHRYLPQLELEKVRQRKADALALLKEQEKQKFFVDENGKITPLPVVIRCKDCKHWEQSNGHCPFNSIFTNADWFCADGRRDEWT